MGFAPLKLEESAGAAPARATFDAAARLRSRKKARAQSSSRPPPAPAPIMTMLEPAGAALPLPAASAPRPPAELLVAPLGERGAPPPVAASVAPLVATLLTAADFTLVAAAVGGTGAVIADAVSEGVSAVLAP
jgi:hypothetical protein